MLFIFPVVVGIAIVISGFSVTFTISILYLMVKRAVGIFTVVVVVVVDVVVSSSSCCCYFWS